MDYLITLLLSIIIGINTFSLFFLAFQAWGIHRELWKYNAKHGTTHYYNGIVSKQCAEYLSNRGAEDICAADYCGKRVKYIRDNRFNWTEEVYLDGKLIGTACTLGPTGIIELIE